MSRSAAMLSLRSSGSSELLGLAGGARWRDQVRPSATEWAPRSVARWVPSARCFDTAGPEQPRAGHLAHTRFVALCGAGLANRPRL